MKDRKLKPFNSLLGETFELVTANYRFFSEQVCHHPPITAYHCESSKFIVTACQPTTARFNGRYIEVVPKNKVYITLKLTDGTLEKYTWSIPLARIHNIVIGKMYIENAGKSMITNHTTGDYCEMEWKERGWSGKNAN